MTASTACVLVFIGLVVRTQTQEQPEVVILLTERHSLFTMGSVYRWDLFKDTITRHNLTSAITPTAIDYDNVTRRIYWTDISREEIRSSTLDGGNNTLVRKLNNVSNPQGLTVDGRTGKIFYTDLGNEVIVSIDMNGSNSTIIASANVSYPIGIVADKTDRKLYWLDHDTNILESCNYDGSGRKVLTSTGIYAPTGLTINEKAGRLYWCEYNGNVYSILKDGSDRKTHYKNTQVKPRLMDIAVFNGFLYIIDRTYRDIRVMPENLNNTHMGILSSRSFKTLTGIHVFSPNSGETGCPDGRYGAGCTSVCGRCTGGMTLCEKTTGSCLAGCDAGYDGNFCTEECKPGTYGKRCSSCGNCKEGTTCNHVTGKCPSGCQTGWKGDTCQEKEQPEVVILLTERHSLFTMGSVYRWDLFKDTITRHNLTSAITPTAIDYDNVTRRIYWTDISREEIRSSTLDGGNNTLVRKLNNVSNPQGLTVDGRAGKIFYTDLGNEVIVSIDMNGSNSTIIASANVSYPIGIVADKTDRKLYWLDHDTNILESCNYDGSGRKVLTSTGIYAPTGLTINEKAGRLYWCEYNGNVYSILKDGSDRKTHYKNTRVKPRLMDIAVFNGFLYIIDRTNRGILVMPENVNNTHMGILSSRSFKTLTGIHVFSPNSGETGCPDGRYGAGCTSVCGRCTGGMTLCEKITGSCLAGCDAGYDGNFCTEECKPGTYGKRCSSCGNCKEGTTCNHVTGKCPSGCQTGWKGDTCQEKEQPEVVILLTERHSLFTMGSVYRWDLFKDTITRHNLTSAITPTAIDYDNVTRRIYWTDISREEIRSSTLDGGNNTLVRKLNNVSNPQGLTVDGRAGKIFYTDLGNEVIVSIDMNGSNSTIIASANVSYPIGIVADKTDRKLYWLDHDTNILESCNYDGSGRKVLTSTGIYAPTGLTINEKAGRLYWCEYNGNVYSILKDGSDRKTHYKNTRVKPRLMDIAVFNGFLYIIDRTNRGILVMPENVNNTHMGILSSRSFKTLTGIHVFSPNSGETGCPDGRYGAGCTSVCGRCTGGMTLCEKTTGSCLAGCDAGYDGNFCTEECRSGMYGSQCSLPCGSCKDGPMCSSTDGACPHGCSAGWKGATCKTRCSSLYYGANCGRMCGYCRGDTCNPLTGVCPNGCQTSWKGPLCQDLNDLTSQASLARGRIVDALVLAAAASRILELFI